MKKHLLIILSALFTFSILFTFGLLLVKNKDISMILSHQISDNINTIIVDAGHGGDDGGAVALDGTLEKDINLDIALKLEKILKLYGFNVIMTRTEDIMTCDENLETIRARKISDIRNRLKILTDNPNAIFVSVHQNKFSDPTQKGSQVFYSDKNEKSKCLADIIQNSIVSGLQPDNKRVIKKCGTDIYLLYHAQLPAVLVECGFISNSEDLKNLKTDEYKTKTAMLIADGILKYIFNG